MAQTVTVKVMRDIKFIDVSNPLLPEEWKDFAFSYNLWICLWMQRRPNRRLNGFLLRLFTRLQESHDVTSFQKDLTSIRQRLMQLVPFSDLFTGLKWGKTMVLIFQLAGYEADPYPMSHDLNCLGTILGWFKRLPLFLPPKEKEWEEYVARNTIREESLDSELIVGLRSLATEWFGSFELDHFSPKHGSGSTADSGRVRSRKWQNLEAGPKQRALLRSNALENLASCKVDRELSSKFAVVPKQLGKNRYICMEPASLQYLQHGLLSELETFISDSKHPLSRIIKLRDQTQNRDLCSQAIQNGLATIDLSNASDCVTHTLVKSIFGHLPLYRYLYGTRSDCVKSEYGNLEPRFFAGMGSAICFILESIVFSMIAECAFRSVTHRTSRGRRDGLSVYGDDIIAPLEVAVQTMDHLVRLGFEVNVDKTFVSGPYRESCGVEYVDDCEVLTIRHPRKILRPDDYVAIDSIDMVVDLANSFYNHGFQLARRFVLMAYLPLRIDLDHKTFAHECVIWHETSLLPPRPNFGHLTVYHHGYQRHVVKRPIYSLQPSSCEEDWIEYWSNLVIPDRLERSRFHAGYDTMPISQREAIDRIIVEPTSAKTGKLHVVKRMQILLPTTTTLRVG